MRNEVSNYKAEEKEIMKKTDEFNSQLQNSLNEGEAIESIEYYEKLDLSDEMTINTDFYIATINGEEGTRIGLFAKNANNLIGYIDESGNIEFIDNYLSHLNLSLNLEDLRDVNYENLRAKIETLEPRELEEDLHDLLIDGEGTQEEEIETDKKEKKDSLDEQTEQVEKALSKEEGEDLEISYYRQIKDNQIEEAFPDKFRGATQKGIAYSKKLNRFICVKEEGGVFKKVEGIEPSKPTRRTIISINEDGSKVERKSPHALLKTDDDRKEMSISFEQYGYIKTGIVNRLPCNERIETQVREAGQGEEGRTNVDLRKKLAREGTEVSHDFAHQFNKHEKIGIEEQNLELIDGDREFELNDGTITTLGKEASKAKVSLGEFIKTFKEADGRTIDEKLENTHNEFERQAGAPDRGRR